MSFVSIILLYCNGGSEAFSIWKMAVLDRTVADAQSPGYYLQPIDITAFSVSRSIWLKQFDMSRVFVYDPVREKQIDYVRVNFRIIQSVKSNPASNRTIFTGNTVLSSNERSSVNLNLHLKSDFNYEIHVDMPNNLQLMYFNFLEIREFEVASRAILSRPTYVTFTQRNKSIRPPAIGNDNLKHSQGIVARLHLLRPWF